MADICRKCGMAISAESGECSQCDLGAAAPPQVEPRPNIMEAVRAVLAAGVALLVIWIVGLIVTSLPSEKSDGIGAASAPALASSSKGVVSERIENTIEYKLALIDAGGRIKKDDIRVNRIRYLIDFIASKTSEPKDSIADLTARCTELARSKYGKEISNAALLEQAKIFYQKPAVKVPYKDASLLLILLMIEGV